MALGQEGGIQKIGTRPDFVSYLKEDDWFIDYVNKRGKLAKTQKKAGAKFTRLEELQRTFK